VVGGIQSKHGQSGYSRMQYIHTTYAYFDFVRNSYDNLFASDLTWQQLRHMRTKNEFLSLGLTSCLMLI